MTSPMAFDFAAAYGDLNPDDSDYRFYAELAVELRATRILDLQFEVPLLTATPSATLPAKVGDAVLFDPRCYHSMTPKRAVTDF